METERQTVLIIDDEPGIRKTLSDILKTKGYETMTAASGAEGLATVAREAPNLVIIDVGLPDMTGIEVLAKIRAASPATEAIILTGSATLESAIEATNNGAFSYLLKPCDVDQLVLHLSRAAEKHKASDMIMEQSVELKKKNVELSALYEEAKSISLHDPLTGLGNRRLLQMHLEKALNSAKRYGDTLSVLMLDIDHFKNYNDTHGHVEGDRLLKKLAGILVKQVRDADWVFRYGGEEFLIVLRETDGRHAGEAAERLRKAVEAAAGVTVSVGYASYHEGRGELTERADAALYLAKKNGRNRVEACPVETADRAG